MAANSVDYSAESWDKQLVELMVAMKASPLGFQMAAQMVDE